MRLLKRLGTLFKKEEEEKELYMKIKLELKGLPCHTEPVFESSSSSTVHLVDAHFPAGSVWGSFFYWFISIGVLALVHQYWCIAVYWSFALCKYIRYFGFIPGMPSVF